MDVSVVIPTRDRPQMLALTLRSVLSQQHVDSEVIVVHDGIDPRTQVLVDRVGDPRVRLLANQGPTGVSGARNTGIAAARGKWIAFLDDDDLWAPSKLASQVTAAEDAGAGWVYAGHVSVDEELRVRDGAPPPPPAQVIVELRRHNSVPAGASSVCVRRDVFGVVGGFDPALRTSEDWDVWLRLAATGLPAFVPRPLVALRVHAGMASRHVDRMLADIEVVAQRHGIPIDRARHERWAAWTCLEDGRRASALRHYARAVRRGDVVSIARAGMVLVNPRVARHRSEPADDEWICEARQWLEPLRAAAEEAPNSSVLSSAGTRRDGRQ